MLLFAACAAPGRAPEPPPAAAVEAFGRARGLWTSGVRADDPDLRAALARARAAAPDWIPPQRMEDDLLRAEHREVEALERRRAQRHAAPQSAAAQYLVARLAGDLQPAAFAASLGLDPDFVWARYAHALARGRAGATVGEVEPEWRAAIAAAPSTWGRVHFSVQLVRFLEGRRRGGAARALLEELLEAQDLRPAEAARVAAELARLELRGPDFDLMRRGYERGLGLLRGGALEDDAFEALVAQLEDGFSADDPGGDRLELALGARDDPLARRLAAEFALRRGALELAGVLDPAELRRLLEQERHGGRERLFAAGRYGDGLQAWLDGLSGQVFADDGELADPRLWRVIEVGIGLDAGSPPPALAELGEALLAAGWYGEAVHVADALLAGEPGAAGALRRRALAGRALFRGLRVGLSDVEDERAETLQGTVPDDPAGGPAARTVGSLDDLLRRWGTLLARCAEQQGAGSPGGEFSRAAVAASPRLEYGLFAQLVHPGPTFSAADARAGLGDAGTPVPGLAAALDHHGRFAIAGAALGQGPDATVLRRLLVEQRSGEHLGVPWSGTVVWGEGTDVDSRAQRNGTGIAGAALHEGYWVDLAAVRGLHRRWSVLGEEYEDTPADRERLARTLASPGLRLRTPPAETRRRDRERTAIRPALGQAARLRLALLAERAAPEATLGEVSLTEIAELIATHEEGHLTDRTRFLPLADNWQRVAAFLLEHGLDARGIQRRLEYRAQLVAMAVIPEPRLALADLLDAAGARGSGGLEHGPAYRELLEDFLDELDGRVAADPAAWPAISREHTLLHQTHRLDPDEVRSIALELARREGLVARRD